MTHDEECLSRPRVPRPSPPGAVIWISGLSGAGKSTLAASVARELEQAGVPVVSLDGDDLRDVFDAADANAGHHDRDARLALALRYSRLCRILASQGLIVVIATISMFREVHRWNREHLPGYFEVFLRVPLDELRRRDPKGIYRRFDRGELANVAGLDLEVDEPRAADLLVDFVPERSIGAITHELLDKFERKQAHEN